jgi:Rrf2 family protein
MPNVLKISEAASIAMHTVLMLASHGGEVLSNSHIASQLKVSENHLAKVLQRLVKVGMVSSVRGPKGGFSLSKDIGDITLLDVYEAIDGPLEMDNCLLKRPICGGGKNCVLGSLLSSVNRDVRKQLSGTKLSELVLKH